MLFNSLEFFVFFAVVTTLYFTIPFFLRLPLLLVASCIFYMAYIPVYILIIFFTIVFDFCAAILIEKSTSLKRKIFLVSSILVNIGVLALYKYFNLIAESVSLFSQYTGTSLSLPALALVLPIGLSFHTFQAMSYTIEVYRGNQKAEKNPGIYALYVMFYPQMVAGPIERPQNLLPQFYEKHSFNYERIADGLKLMAWGLFKKVVIADRLAVVVNAVYGEPHRYQGFILLIATLFFTFQIYCDFSGYSDIALGCARVMGFKLMKNFDKPYISTSVIEFWRRWHISLSTWFKDYLYIPLGGNRTGKFRWCMNIFIVFLLSGLWHGANVTFLIWGALHGFFYLLNLVSAKIFGKNLLPGFFNILLTFACVSFAWIFFRARSMDDAVYITENIFPQLKASTVSFFTSVKQGNTFSGAFKLQQAVFTNVQWYLSILLILGVVIFQLLGSKETFLAKLKLKPAYQRWMFYYIFVAAILLLGKFENNEFIYFQF